MQYAKEAEHHVGTKYTNNKAYTSNKNRIPKPTSAKEIVMFFLCTVEH